MRTKEVVISNPKRDAVNNIVFRTIIAGDTVEFFESVLQALDELLEWAEFF